jgi:hypothetical protein
MSQVTNLAFFRARSGQSEALERRFGYWVQLWVPSRLSGTCGTHEQDKERLYEHTQF